MSFLKAIRMRVASIMLAAGIFAAHAGTPQALPKVTLPVIPERVLNLADFGGVGDGRTLNTGAFEKAFTALAEKGGGKLVVPPGIWLTGPIKPASNINLHLERGALIQFARELEITPSRSR